MNRYVIAFLELKTVHFAVGTIYHKVDIKGNGACAMQLFDEVGAKRIVGNENTVHNINVKIFYSVFLKLLELLTKLKKVGAHKGRGDHFFHGDICSPFNCFSVYFST